MSLTAIDLFSGGGGLTVGLKKAGFRVVVAVEIEKASSATYRANHREVEVVQQDITAVSGKTLKEIAGTEEIDLLAGCPPCQGFTSLTRKHRKNDPRNILVFQMSRLVEELRPRAVMMENVPGLAQRGGAVYGEFKRRLKRIGYRVEEDVLEAADYGVPQRRRRLVLLAGKGFRIDMPKSTHSKNGRNGLPFWRTVGDSIGCMKEPVRLGDIGNGETPSDLNWHVVRNLSGLNQKRIRLAVPGETWRSIPEHLRPNCHRNGYRGFVNVYGRMRWDQPAPTITGGCTTFSKGRFGHPEKDRTISVREAAMLQTFPENYRFETAKMQSVCDMIGNALPCVLAEAISRQCVGKLL